MRKIFDALDRHSGSVQTVCGLLAVLLAVFAIFQTNKSLKMTREALYLSSTPTLDVDLQQDKLILKNPGIESLWDVRINMIFYKLGQNPTRIQARSEAAGNYFYKNELRVGESVEIPESIFNATKWGDPLFHWDGYPVRGLVITFKRSFDKKKYLHFEPLQLADGMLPFYSHQFSASSGPAVELYDFIPELEKKERLRFGVAKEVRGND